jgi:hypothetical protein
MNLGRTREGYFLFMALFQFRLEKCLALLSCILVINTLRNSGHKLNLSYFVDESFVKADEETVKRFVRTQPGLLDYDLAAR